MPQKLDDCLKQIRAKWQANPGSKPKPRDGEDEESMAYAICRASLNLEQEQSLMLEGGVGPAIVAIAATAKPHLRQRGGEITVVEKDGHKLARVPIFKKGVYRHPNGKLIFNDEIFDAMIRNHQARVTDYAVGLDFRHSDKMGLLAFLDPEDGGRLEKEEDWLVAYGPLAGDEEEKIIKSRKWRYASAEFWRDYKSNLQARLSTEQLEEISQEDLLKEAKMPKKFVFGDLVVTGNDQDDKFVLEADSVDALGKLVDAYGQLKDEAGKVNGLETEVKEQKDKVTALEQKVAELEADDDDDGDDDDELPAEVRERIEKLEARAEAAERQRDLEKIALAIKGAEAYRDKDGRGHSPVFLELAKKAMLMEPVGDDGAIKLESKEPADVVSYYRNVIRLMLETNPGVVPMSGNTEGDNQQMQFEQNPNQLGHVSLEGVTEEELKAAYAELDKF